MIKPSDHPLESERQRELDSYSILDSLSEEDYDNLTAIASEICNTPIALISLLDDKRQWFKSHHGLEAQETPKEQAFCAHAILDMDHVMIVQDARLDQRFHDNPLVTGDPHVIFYAGVPLVTESGLPLGTLCVIDQKPQLLSNSQINSLKALSNQVMNLLELRKTKIQKEKALLDLQSINQDLERFATLAAHDIKSPLNNIISLTSIFSSQFSKNINSEGQRILALIDSSCHKLREMVDGLLQYSRSDVLIKEQKSKINLEKLNKDITGLFKHDNEISITLKSSLSDIDANKTALEQILINLVANSIKYNDKPSIKIEIGVSEDISQYTFYVKDNGRGIEPQNFDKIFGIFNTFEENDRHGQTGNGIGLATVKKVVETFGGSIHVDSELKIGSIFTFTMLK